MWKGVWNFQHRKVPGVKAYLPYSLTGAVLGGILQNILSIWTVLWDNEKKSAHKNIFYHREEDTDL